MKKTFLFLSALIGVFLFVLASILGGFQVEGYSHIEQFISESYAIGLPYSTYLQYMYMLSGLLLAFFAFMTPSVIRMTKAMKAVFILIAIFYGIVTIFTGIFPCEIGCKFEGFDLSISQLIHNFIGLLTYLIVPLCLVILGGLFKKSPGTKIMGTVTLCCGLLALFFVLVLFAVPQSAFIGLFQRIIEGTILFWFLRVAFFVKNTVTL